MTDKTDSKEREAFEAWYITSTRASLPSAGDGWSDDQIRDSFMGLGTNGKYRSSSAQIASEGWMARASLAANAGSEPVAHLWQHSETGRTRVLMPDMVVDACATWLLVRPLYLHPSPPEGMVGGWMPLIEAPNNEIVLVAAEFDGPGDWRIKCGYLDGQTAKWRVFGASWEPTHWMPLPPPPTSSADSRKGD